MDLTWLFYIFLLLPFIVFFLFYQRISIRSFNVPPSAHIDVPVTIVYTLDSVFRNDIVLTLRMVAPNGRLDDAVVRIESSIIAALEKGTVITFSGTLTARAENGSGPRVVTADIKTRGFVQNYASAVVIVTV